MNLNFKYYLVNDHSKYCIHHGNCSYCVDQQIAVCHPGDFHAHDSTYSDQKSNWDYVGNQSISHFHGKFE